MSFILYPPAHSFLDYPSPDGSCITIYFIGCPFKCKGCHNESLQVGTLEPVEKIESGEHLFNIVEEYCKKFRTNKVCFMGGEPLYNKYVYNNLENLKDALALLNEKSYEVCIYTGYDEEDNPWEFLDDCQFTYIKCGKYLEDQKQQSKKTDNHFVLGSKNQVVYNNKLEKCSNNGIMEFKE